MVPARVGIEPGNEPDDAAAVGERGADDDGVALAVPI